MINIRAVFKTLHRSFILVGLEGDPPFRTVMLQKNIGKYDPRFCTLLSCALNYVGRMYGDPAAPAKASAIGLADLGSLGLLQKTAAACDRKPPSDPIYYIEYL